METRLPHEAHHLNALKQHHVGLEESDDGVWSLYLGSVLLGRIDERTMKVYG